MEHDQITIAEINHQRAIRNELSDFLVSRWKNWPLSRGYFDSWGRAVVAVAVVERSKQESIYMDTLSAGTKTGGY